MILDDESMTRAPLLTPDGETLGGDDEQATEIWRKYEKGVDHHRQLDLYGKTDRAYRFFIGDQWHGLKNGGEEIPVMNFLQPIVEHKVASVAMNAMSINYSPMRYGGSYQEAQQACETLNRYAERQWEALKMDARCWEILRDACITGNSYLYFYDQDLNAQILDTTEVYLGDESSRDLQAQPYIILRERRLCRDLRAQAIKNGLTEEQAARIVPDRSDDDTVIGDDAKKRESVEDKWCTSLVYMTKDEEGIVNISRSTKTVIWQECVKMQGRRGEEYCGEGLKLYPLAGLCWIPKKNSSRGTGEILPLIPNQIEANKMLARRLMNAKITAFGRLVYNSDFVDNPASVDKVGAPIKLRGTSANRIREIVDYLQPSQMSPDAKTLTDELISVTRDLAGAGDAALGQIDPTKASGAAIIAVRDQAALPLNEQVSVFRQFCEDVAAIWFAMWSAYHPDGMEIELPPAEGEQDPQKAYLSPDVLEGMRINIRIDVSQNNPFSKYAQEQSLTGLYQSQAIRFEEFVEALDDNSSIPKAKLLDILEKRREEAARQQAMQEASAQAKLQQAAEIIAQQQAVLQSYGAEQDQAQPQATTQPGTNPAEMNRME